MEITTNKIKKAKAGKEFFMELYYAIMNIVDYIALNKMEYSESKKLFDILETLRKLSGDSVLDIALANDSNADNWLDLVVDIYEQFETGKRIKN